ncbi:EamA family transporter [Candidatus Woesearchaeota archaeon]|nr:EamA family transporter [Candidatus Woesearchaeota archaeon]
MSLALLFTSVVFSVTGQLLLKYATTKTGELHLTKNTFNTLIKIFTNKFIILGLTSYVISAMLWLIVLSRLDLSFAYPLASSSYILIAITSKVFFKEKISKLRWLSIIIIMLGVVLLSNS